jgi:hypothetical protein
VKESTVEQYLKKRIRELGGVCVKLNSKKGISDRLVILPGNRIEFVELKTPIGELSEAQKLWNKRLESLGCVIKVINSKEGVDNLYKEK